MHVRLFAGTFKDTPGGFKGGRNERRDSEIRQIKKEAADWSGID